MITYSLTDKNAVHAKNVPTGEIYQPDYRNGEIAFSTERDLMDLAAGWPANRLVQIWNNIPGVKPVNKFMNRKRAVERIWEALMDLTAGYPEQAEESDEPAAEEQLWVAPQFRAQGPGEWESGPARERVPGISAPEEQVSSEELIERPASKESETNEPQVALVEETKIEEKPSKECSFPQLVQKFGLRSQAKNTKIVELLSRPNGATIQELMAATGWQIHTCQGFIAGTLGTKWGLVVASEVGQTKLDRRYRILGPGENKPAKEPKTRTAPAGQAKAPTKGELQARIGELLDFVSQVADEAPPDTKQGFLALKLNVFIHRARELAGLTEAAQ